MTIINRKKSRTVVKIQLTSMSILKIEKNQIDYSKDDY